MGRVPQGFINKGLDVARKELFNNLHRGGRHEDDYYFSLAAEQVWYEYMDWKVIDSAMPESRSLSLGDVAFACRVSDIPYIKPREDEILITMPNHSYMFSEYSSGVYGGPVDKNMNYQGYCLIEPVANITMKTFIKLLRYFDGIIDSIKDEVLELIHEICHSYKVSRIMNESLKPFLEPGLEDIKYRYSCYIEKDRPFVMIYLYDVPDNNKLKEIGGQPLYFLLRVVFGWEELMGNLEAYKNMLRNLSSGTADFERYDRWAKPVEPWDEEAPEWSEEKQF